MPLARVAPTLPPSLLPKEPPTDLPKELPTSLPMVPAAVLATLLTIFSEADFCLLPDDLVDLEVLFPCFAPVELLIL